jgi:hypothetical protein
VERFTLFVPAPKITEQESSAGEWVRYDDHARIVAGKNAQLADCFKRAGADCDGASDEVIAPRAPRAVRNLRKDYDEACEEADQLRRRCEELEGDADLLREARELAFSHLGLLKIYDITDGVEQTMALIHQIAAALAARQASAKGGAE